MRKLVSVRKIDEVQPIEKADRVEKVRLGGWWCVVSKDYHFKAGDLCYYYEVDSLIPLKSCYLFLEINCAKEITLINGTLYEGYRLRTKTFRGVTSQGLVLPLSYFPEIQTTEGQDVTDLLGVVKYERILSDSMDKDIIGDFPGYLSKTDEERIQNLIEYLDKYRDRKFYVSEKLDGCSSSFCKYENEFDVYQKTVQLKRFSDNPYWAIAKKYNLAEKIPNNFAVQAEAIGPGIDNALGLPAIDGFVFSVFDIQKAQYLGLEDMIKFSDEIGMKTVPIIYPEFVLDHTCDQLLVLANRKSVLNPKKDAEGLVFRLKTTTEKVSFKVISNLYLEKNKK